MQRTQPRIVVTRASSQDALRPLLAQLDAQLSAQPDAFDRWEVTCAPGDVDVQPERDWMRVHRGDNGAFEWAAYVYLDESVAWLAPGFLERMFAHRMADQTPLVVHAACVGNETLGLTGGLGDHEAVARALRDGALARWTFHPREVVSAVELLAFSFRGVDMAGKGGIDALSAAELARRAKVSGRTALVDGMALCCTRPLPEVAAVVAKQPKRKTSPVAAPVTVAVAAPVTVAVKAPAPVAVAVKATAPAPVAVNATVVDTPAPWPTPAPVDAGTVDAGTVDAVTDTPSTPPGAVMTTADATANPPGAPTKAPRAKRAVAL